MKTDWGRRTMFGPLETFECGMDRELPLWHRPLLGQTVLNLGAGLKNVESTIPLDLPKWDANLDMIPFGDQEVDGIIAYHFLEHVQNIMFLLKECQRVLKPLGFMNIVVPYGASDCALQDLDHKHRFMEDTWKNTFHNPYYDKGDWQFTIGFNMVMGLNHRNLVLVTQLIKNYEQSELLPQEGNLHIGQTWTSAPTFGKPEEAWPRIPTGVH